MKQPDPKLMLVQRFFAGTGKSYDFMVNGATLGIDRLWKRKMVNMMPPNPRRILDFACGTGISTLAIANRYPDCQVVGVELREEYLEVARYKVQKLGVNNIELVLSRAEDYRSKEPFDCISSSYLAKYADLKLLTHSSKTMLKEGGLLLMHDFTFPPKPYLVQIWRFYFKMLQTIGTFFFPSWREIYYGLPQLIEESPWLSELKESLQQEGFRHIQMEYLTLYGSAIVSARK
ncbi:class I SAM-dependent methyltransferase [Nitrosococcus wardiae]|uniref:Methyltransferase domain-containing protein n=1 Tax=Nitrosococcus wardiae TaxID=1814290 RepID=A0A4P7BUJ4_9GAMM|nr:class I SAM-dependent methyltransferase [Nitrosococcus wardiae]QBQ53491.1 methyltransferase domain-containing protein [Nitrosococcus wardiae]